LCSLCDELAHENAIRGLDLSAGDRPPKGGSLQVECGVAGIHGRSFRGIGDSDDAVFDRNRFEVGRTLHTVDAGFLQENAKLGVAAGATAFDRHVLGQGAMREDKIAEVTRDNGERPFDKQAIDAEGTWVSAAGWRRAGNLDIAAQMRANPVGREDTGEALENAGIRLNRGPVSRDQCQMAAFWDDDGKVRLPCELKT
jgi:hypothetical protein